MSNNFTNPIALEIAEALKEEFGTTSNEWTDENGNPLPPEEVGFRAGTPFIITEPDGQQYKIQPLEDRRLNGYDFGVCALKLAPDSSAFYGFAYNRVVPSEQPGILLASLSEEADALRQDLDNFLASYEQPPTYFPDDEEQGALLPDEQTVAPINDTLPEGEQFDPSLTRKPLYPED